MNDGCCNNNNKPSGDALSWIIVIICLVAFWPLGLFLLLRKISINPKKSGNNKTSPQQQNNVQGARPSNDRQTYKPDQQQQRYAQQPPSQSQRGQDQRGQDQRGQYYAQQQPNTTRPNTKQKTNSGQYYQTPDAHYYRYQPAQTNPSPVQKPGKVKKEKRQKDTAKRSGGKALSAFLLILGIIFSMIGLAFVSTGASELVSNSFNGQVLWAFITGVFFCTGGLISFITRGNKLQRNRRLNKYLAIIGDREVVSIKDMIGSCGVSARTLRRDLQDMAEDGFFGASAYFDIGLDSLVLTAAAAEQTRNEAAHASKAPQAEESGNQYMVIINHLRDLRCKTVDIAIADKIQKIEDLTAKIFRIVEDKPEKVTQIRRFMNYYLPTTIKLLNSYQTLEKQGISGENITSAKQDIERILDTLTSGYEQQLDNLFKSDKLDISADIDVLENMMEQDGLKTDGDNILKTAGGN
jgi:hypothetical protein